MAMPVLIAIGAMWLSVAIFFLGKGEPKGTGAITGVVGAVTVLGAILQAAVFKDPFVAGLLFAHGIFYCAVSYALLTGLEDLRSVGNVSLYTALVSVIYMVSFLYRWTGPGGRQALGRQKQLSCVRLRRVCGSDI